MKSVTVAGLALASLFITSLVTPSQATAEDNKDMKHAAGKPMGTAAAAAMPMVPAKPPAELDATYKPLDGSWSCETTFLPNAMGTGSPEIKTKTSIKFKKDLNGFWYRGDYDAKKSSGFPGMKGTLYLGHDGKQLLMTSVDAMGALSAGTGSASGDTLTFNSDGYMMGNKLKIRETIEKKGAKEVIHRFEVDTGKGFQPMGEDVCKR